MRDGLRSLPMQIDVEHGSVADPFLDEGEGLGYGGGGAYDLKTGRFESLTKFESHKRVVIDHQYSCFHRFLTQGATTEASISKLAQAERQQRGNRQGYPGRFGPHASSFPVALRSRCQALYARYPVLALV